jgi:hypothetical protein
VAVDLRPGAVGAVKRSEGKLDLTISGLGAFDNGRYHGEAPPPLQKAWFRQENGLWTYDSPRGTQQELFRDDFLHVGGRRGATLRRTTGQTINTGAAAAITWPTEDYDSDNFISAGGSLFIVPYGMAGVYEISFGLSSNVDLAAAFGTWVRIVAGGRSYTMSTGDRSQTDIGYGISLYLADGDTVQITLDNTSGANASITGRVDVYKTDESDYGDTGWAVTRDVNTGRGGVVTQLAGEGSGVARIFSDETVGGVGKVIRLHKDHGSLAIGDQEAQWFSARVRVDQLPGVFPAGPNYGIGLQQDDPVNPNWAGIVLQSNLDSGRWYVASGPDPGFETETLVEAVVDEWIDIDLVALGGGFVAGWVNGAGPAITGGWPVIGQFYEPYFNLQRFTTDPASSLDVDWVRVVAFTGFVHPDALDPSAVDISPETEP